MDIFEYHANKTAEKSRPLAERVRPKTLSRFVGQEHVVGQGTLIRGAIEQDKIFSMILWGPPGCGKTTLARIIALAKPYITTAPLEGLTAQTLESEGGMLFTDRQMLKEKVIRLACDKDLRSSLSDNLKRYLKEVVSWEIIAKKYKGAYRYARLQKIKGEEINLPPDF